MQLVRSSAKVGDTNAEALYYLAIASARKLDRAHRRLLRPPAGVHRRALRGGRARGRRAHPRPRPAHRQGLRPGRRAAPPTTQLLEAGVRAVRVPADDAAREDPLRRRRLVVGRARSTSTTARSSSTTRSRCASGTRASPASCTRRSSTTSSAPSEIEPGRWSAARPAPARRRGRDDGASPRALTAPILRRVLTQSRRRAGASRPSARCCPGAGSRAATRCSPRSATPTRRCCACCAPAATPSRSRRRSRRSGCRASTAPIWVGARRPRRLDRRPAGAASGCSPAPTGPARGRGQLRVKLAVGRQRPLIEEHPPLARAPTKLSFPSAHATSSVAAATALGRVEPRARPYLFALAAAICVGRPYLGMHYPSDVLGGAALGFCLGSLVPGLGARRPRSGCSSSPSTPTSARRRAARRRATAAPRRRRPSQRRRPRARVKIGIVGLPNAGKSTLFNALTRAGAETGDYAFTTIDPNVAIVGGPRRAARAGRRDASARARSSTRRSSSTTSPASSAAPRRARASATSSSPRSARPTRSATSSAATPAAASRTPRAASTRATTSS